jgi:phenylacetate-CoA ligase
MDYFKKEVETISEEGLRAVQNEKLKWLVNHCYEDVPYYKQLFDQNGLKPQDIRTVDDLVKIPITRKTSIKSTYPFGLLGVPLSKVERLQSTSGTTSVPYPLAYTKEDVLTLQEQVARAMFGFGVRPGDLVYQSYGYGTFLGGISVDLGCRGIGATLFPAGPGRTALAIHWLRDLKPKAISCTPSFARHLATYAQERGLDPKKDWAHLKIGMFGGEAAAPAVRKKVREAMTDNFMYHEFYGTSELFGNSIATSCEYSCGNSELHVMADHFYLELIDPETGKRIEPGEDKEGELVFTSLSKVASPMLRWGTHDLTRYSRNALGCECGRVAHPIIRALTGRGDDALKVRGALVFPSEIEDVVTKVEGTGDGWQIVIGNSDKESLQELVIQVEVAAKHKDDLDKRALIKKYIEDDVYGRFSLRPVVQIMDPGALPRYESKSVRVVKD